MSEIEDKARAQGWVPQDEFRGDPEKWKPAEEFLEYGEKHNGVLKDRINKLIDENKRISSILSETQTTLQEFKAFKDGSEKRAVERAIKELKAERAVAISAADGDRVNEIDDQIDKLKKVEAPKPTTPAETQTYRDWLKDNPWYNDDPELAEEADIAAAVLYQTGRYKDEASLFNAVAARVKRSFPDKFNNPRRSEPADVDVGRPSTPGRKKGYNDLPADAKAMCDKFCKTIKGFTKEMYLADYEWD